jgi:hypothetical protein
LTFAGLAASKRKPRLKSNSIEPGAEFAPFPARPAGSRPTFLPEPA